MLQRTPEPVELGHHQLIARAIRRQERLIELGPARELARCLVDEDLLAAGCNQRVLLRLGMLSVSRDPPVADPHDRRTVSRTPNGVTKARTRQALHSALSNHRWSRPWAGASRERTFSDTLAAARVWSRRSNSRQPHPVESRHLIDSAPWATKRNPRCARLTTILALGFGRFRKSEGHADDPRPTAAFSAGACNRTDYS